MYKPSPLVLIKIHKLLGGYEFCRSVHCASGSLEAIP